ncbi:MAG: SDR family oxidoreductase [Cyanobacteria bacterium P01_G01_bin.49]
MKALVAGATGETGRRIVQQLIDRQIAVRALVRDSEKGKEILPPEAELVVGDVLDPDSLEKAIIGCTVLLCATGARPSLNPTGPYQVDYEGTKNLVNVAKIQGIKQFVLVSSLCVSQFFHPLNLFWLVLFWKKQAETYLQNSGLNYIIVRPGGLINENNSNPILMSSADTLFEGRIPRQKVAQICVDALFDDGSNEQILEVITKPNSGEN